MQFRACHLSLVKVQPKTASTRRFRDFPGLQTVDSRFTGELSWKGFAQACTVACVHNLEREAYLRGLLVQACIWTHAHRHVTNEQKMASDRTYIHIHACTRPHMHTHADAHVCIRKYIQHPRTSLISLISGGGSRLDAALWLQNENLIRKGETKRVPVDVCRAPDFGVS